uniref:Uncharacterized protein n=1 Tax=Caenorhabditis japonica TaxID=281687 RepID=A0A8R1EWY4_CAEJA
MLSPVMVGIMKLPISVQTIDFVLFIVRICAFLSNCHRTFVPMIMSTCLPSHVFSFLTSMCKCPCPLIA